MEPKIHFYKGLSSRGFHNIRYLEWGEASSETVVRTVVLCVHGLSRNAHDFDYLAQDLAAQGHRVICPDLPGRGESDWLSDPSLYVYPQYLSDLTALIARSGAEKVHWVGTSMGGLLGWLMALQPKTPVQSLVLNDVGAFIPGEALARIQKYVSNPPVFPNRERAEVYMRHVLKTFGLREEEHFSHLLKYSIRLLPDGTAYLAYDPKIAEAPIKGDADFWGLWGQLECPVMVLRGMQSDILTAEIANRMRELKPQMVYREIMDCGHAPALMDEEQISMIRAWLLNPF